MNDFINPNAPGRPFSFNPYSEAGGTSNASHMFNGAPPLDSIQQNSQLPLTTFCNGSQKTETPASGYEWLSPAATPVTSFKPTTKRSEATPFDDPRSLWENTYNSMEGPTPQPGGLWEFANPPSSQPVSMKDRLCDTPSTSRNSLPPFSYFSNVGFGYNDGVLMSPGSKDMAALGLQMADQVLSNSPSNACTFFIFHI